MFVVILLKGKKSEMKRTITQIFTLLLLVTLAVPAFAGKVLAEKEYFYSDDGTLVGKAFNGKRVNFEYDLRGQLLAVKDASGKDLERYTYDPAGNRLSKTINGVTTAYTYDTITVNANTNNPYEEVIYTGLKNGGNRGVAVLNSATYANFRAQFAENISVPSSIISDEWYNVSLGTRINIIMTGWNDGGSADNPTHIYGTDGTPKEYYFKLYSVTGYARYTFTYQTRVWE